MVGVWSLAGGVKSSANYYEWEAAAELMKKKEKRKKHTFFIRHPRIINRVQDFWWGWRKPQDTSNHRGQWDTEGEGGCITKKGFCWEIKQSYELQLALKKM